MSKLNIEKEKNVFIETFPGCKSDVEKFFQFVEMYCDVTPANRDEWFRGVDSIRVKECLKKLCDNGIFKRKTKARNFVNAIAKFFNHLLAQGLDNGRLKDELKGDFNKKSVPYYENLMDYIMNEPKLKGERIFSPIDSNEIEMLINYCNELINRRIFYKKGSEPKIFGQMVSALSLKLILLTGISYSTARLLEFNNLNAQFGIITINEIPVLLPPELSYQFREYARIYLEKGLKTDGSKLFVGKNGEAWKTSTSHSGMVAVLKAALNKSSISEINRFAIQQHIKNGLPERTVLQLTGEEKEVLTKCYYGLQEEDDGFSFVNSALIKNSIYSKL